MSDVDHTIARKRCAKCRKSFPGTAEYFHRDKHRPDGLTVRCRSCVLRHSTKPREIVQPIQNGFKRCSKCKIIKPATDQYFHRSIHKPSGFVSNCTECIAQDSKIKRPQYRDSNANHERKRRTLSAGLAIGFNGDDWHHAKEWFNHGCAICSKQNTRLERDHWIPITDSRIDNPGYVTRNILPLCRSCNSSKNGRDPIQWLNWKFGICKAKVILNRIREYFASLS